MSKQREELDARRKKKEKNKINVEIDEDRFKATRMVDEEEIQAKLKKSKAIDTNLLKIDEGLTFKNPLADFGDDIYVSDEERRMDIEEGHIDPN